MQSLTDGPVAVERIVAIVVTYEPDPDQLRRALAAIGPQVSATILVDNGSRDGPPLSVGDTVLLLRMPSNLGIGAAQNVGIRAAAERGATFVLLMDQDSVPAPDMVARLFDVHHRAAANGQRVAAVGARIVDPDGNEDGFVRFRRGRYEGVAAASAERAVDCDMLIASGTLIPVAALNAIGVMAEHLFIDKVDTEWCLRAQAHGWRLLGAPQAVLHHRLGEHSVRLWFGHWRTLRLHKPFRYYYMVRNGLLLHRSPHRTPAWCRAERRQRLSIFLYFGLLKPRGCKPLYMMLRGLLDGMRNVGGPLR